MKHPPFQTGNARRLRRELTPAEVLLWKVLRGRKLGGLKFRRQAPIDRYFADFVCFEARLIVELDGDSHAGREDYDRMRQEYLESQGFVVIRFENFETKLTENAVVERIVRVCREQGIRFPLTPDPSPAEGEGSQNKIPLTPTPSPAEGEGSQNKIPLTPNPSPAEGEGS